MKTRFESTNISALDDLFGYFGEQCFHENITFQLNVLGGIPQMLKDAIPCDQLEKLISNHIQNAITAINQGKHHYRNILVSIGLSGDSYLFTVMDSGVHFDVEALEKLGKERVATNSNQAEPGSAS